MKFRCCCCPPVLFCAMSSRFAPALHLESSVICAVCVCRTKSKQTNRLGEKNSCLANRAIGSDRLDHQKRRLLFVFFGVSYLRTTNTCLLVFVFLVSKGHFDTNDKASNDDKTNNVVCVVHTQTKTKTRGDHASLGTLFWTWTLFGVLLAERKERKEKIRASLRLLARSCVQLTQRGRVQQAQQAPRAKQQTYSLTRVHDDKFRAAARRCTCTRTCERKLDGVTTAAALAGRPAAAVHAATLPPASFSHLLASAHQRLVQGYHTTSHHTRTHYDCTYKQASANAIAPPPPPRTTRAADAAAPSRTAVSAVSLGCQCCGYQQQQQQQQ